MNDYIPTHRETCRKRKEEIGRDIAIGNHPMLTSRRWPLGTTRAVRFATWRPSSSSHSRRSCGLRCISVNPSGVR